MAQYGFEPVWWNTAWVGKINFMVAPFALASILVHKSVHPRDGFMLFFIRTHMEQLYA